ncbi:hypothetical protein BCH_00153 [Brucella sp. 191011898]|nr:hypothetical protein BCH_00153 [Brucella sp. 191011898]
MGSRVDAAREAGNNAKAFAAKIVRQLFGKARADQRRIARADNGNRRFAKHARIALDNDEWGRRFAIFELRRIFRLAHADEARTYTLNGFQFALGFIHGDNANRSCAAAAYIEIGQHF